MFTQKFAQKETVTGLRHGSDSFKGRLASAEENSTGSSKYLDTLVQGEVRKMFAFGLL